VCALGGLAAASAQASDLTVQGKTLTVAPADGSVRSDPNASGGSALRMTGNGAAHGDVTTSRPSVHIFVRARGEGCFGPVAITVAIDGVEKFASQVSSGGYSYVGGRMSIPAGAHRVSVAMTNEDVIVPFCARDAWIDTITLVGEPFSPNGWRNAPLKRNARIARHSKAMVAELVSQIRSAKRGAGVGTTQYSSPVYVVPPGEPTVKVAAVADRPDLQAQWRAVPLPADARPAAGTDQDLVVWQPSTDTLWEFWGLQGKSSPASWRARYGGRMQHVSRDEGQFGNPPGSQFGASATSISLLAGMQRIAELQRGEIDHAVDFAVLAHRGRDGWCWPAERTDPHQTSRAKGAIPAGARFRFPPGFDLAAYARDPRHPLSRYALTVATAVQRYGMVVRESSSQPGFYAEDPAPVGFNPYPAIFQDRTPDSLGVLQNFPWGRLKVLAQPRGKGCVDRPAHR
jgi:hypothetical protein